MVNKVLTVFWTGVSRAIPRGRFLIGITFIITHLDFRRLNSFSGAGVLQSSMHQSEWFTDPSPVWFRVVASIPRYSGKLRQTWNSCEKFIAAQVVQWRAFLYKKRIFFNSASVLLNSLMNKVVVHSKESMLFYFFNWKTFKKHVFWKNHKSKSRLDQKICQFVFFHCDVFFDKLSINIGGNFLCNSLLRRNKRLLISGQNLIQSSWKLVQNEADYSLTLKFYFFCEIFGARSEMGPSLTSFSQIVQKSFKAIYLDQTVLESLSLESCIFFEEKKLNFHHFSKTWKFSLTFIQG